MGKGVPQDLEAARKWMKLSTDQWKPTHSTHHERRKNMIYENYKNGMLRVFVVLSIPLVLVTYFEYDLSFTNNFFYSVEILFQTLVIFGCIYLLSLLIIKPFIR